MCSVTQLAIKDRHHLPPKLHSPRDNHTQRPCPLCPLQRRLPADCKLGDVDQRLDRPSVGKQDGTNAVAHCDEGSAPGVREDGECMEGVVCEEEHGDVGPVAGTADDVPFHAFVGYLSGVDHGGWSLGMSWELDVCAGGKNVQDVHLLWIKGAIKHESNVSGINTLLSSCVCTWSEYCVLTAVPC